MVERIRGWGARHLSYSGRVTLINSVLATIQSYWATIFLIPNNIMNRINAICRNYLWSGSSDYKKAPNINWQTCCLPKEEGGLGIRDPKIWNKALLGKYVWWLANKKDHLWVRWVNHVYMKGMDCFDYKAPTDCSWSWKKIVTILTVFKQAYVGSKWLNSDSQYSVAAGYDWLRECHPKVDWRFVCWNSLNIPKCSYIFWEFMHRKLPTRDRLARIMPVNDLQCPICQQQPENQTHLFMDCDYIIECNRALQLKLLVTFNLQDLVTWYSTGRRVSKLKKRIVGACHVALIYWVWRVRNEARLEGYVRRPGALIQSILTDVKTRFLKKNVSKLSAMDANWIQNS